MFYKTYLGMLYSLYTMKNVNAIVKADCLDILNSIDLAPFKNKKILVTGANGLLGQYLANLFFVANREKNLNCSLTCVTLHEPNIFLKRILGGKIKFKKLNLAKPFKLPEKFDYIFHAAGYGQPAKFAKNQLATIKINVDATEKLLEIAKRSQGTLVFFSSAEIYGELPKETRAVSEEYNGSCSTTNTRSVYGESKRLGETLCAMFSREYGVKAKIVRLSHHYGPGISIHDTRVLADFMRNAFFKKEIHLLSEGKEIKTFGYVADAVKMILHVAARGQELVYNVGGIHPISIKGLAEMVGKEIGAKVFPPKKSTAPHAIHHAGFVKLDLSRILSEMKHFSFTPLKTGLKKTIAWNKEEFSLN